MLTQSSIDAYIKTIPPIPDVVKKTMKELSDGDLVRAADVAVSDKALMNYLQNIVNKPIFGFRSTIKDSRQLFGILGLERAKQLIHSYSILLLAPSKWEVFEFDTHKFQELQARLIYSWGKILEHLNSDNKELHSAITIIPASLIVCEMLFRPIEDSVKLLQRTKNISYEEILYKMTEKNLFDIALLVAKEWNFDESIISLIQNLSNPEAKDKITCYMKMLLVFEMSRPIILQSGLSELFNLKVDCDESLSENFFALMGEE